MNGIRLTWLRHHLVLTVAVLLGSACCLVALPVTVAAAATAITVNGTGPRYGPGNQLQGAIG